ncbi:hypothetical protein DL93DRAFT_2086530 [Clavulina sp. PMI_390]|nr:hypothetical protein DL93DRAFT_2086530 [Clavulina sp. PMI_390]
MSEFGRFFKDGSHLLAKIVRHDRCLDELVDDILGFLDNMMREDESLELERRKSKGRESLNEKSHLSNIHYFIRHIFSSLGSFGDRLKHPDITSMMDTDCLANYELWLIEWRKMMGQRFLLDYNTWCLYRRPDILRLCGAPRRPAADLTLNQISQTPLYSRQAEPYHNTPASPTEQPKSANSFQSFDEDEINTGFSAGEELYNDSVLEEW